MQRGWVCLAAAQVAQEAQNTFLTISDIKFIWIISIKCSFWFSLKQTLPYWRVKQTVWWTAAAQRPLLIHAASNNTTIVLVKVLHSMLKI